MLALTLPGLMTDVALIAAGRAHLPAAVLVAIASGATVAPVGTGTRTVWSATIADAGDRQAAHGLMTAVGEVSFFTGPLLAGRLAAVSATLAVAGSAALALVGALVFATAEAARAHGRTAGTRTGGRVFASLPCGWSSAPRPCSGCRSACWTSPFR